MPNTTTERIGMVLNKLIDTPTDENGLIEAYKEEEKDIGIRYEEI